MILKRLEILNELLMVEIIVVAVNMLIAMFLTQKFFESKIDVFIILFAMFIGISALIEILDDYYYTISLTALFIMGYRLFSRDID